MPYTPYIPLYRYPNIEMEFADLIKISRVDNVRLRRPAEDPCEVTVAVTGHHLILSIQVGVQKICSMVIIQYCRRLRIGQRIREKYGFYIETYMEFSETPKVPDLELCH